MTKELKGPPVTFSKVVYRAYRGITRVVMVLARRLPEGGLKNRIRFALVGRQHSLPVEFMTNPRDVAIQIGTPHTKTLERMALALGPQGLLILIEAMPDTFARLVEFVRRRGITNVRLVEGAACNESGWGELVVSPLPGDHKLPVEGITIDNDDRPENAELGSVRVRLIRLDDELDDLAPRGFDLLSVTVNGAELEVLRGARELLARSASGARVYAKGHALDASGTPIHVEVKKYLEERGFKAKITRGEPNAMHERRAGDVIAVKE